MKPKCKCPLCGALTMQFHCESTRCGWMKCTTDSCGAVIDPLERRGSRLIPEGGTLMTVAGGKQVRTRFQRLVLTETKNWRVHPADTDVTPRAE